MSQYRPTIDDLLSSVREAIEQLIPKLDGEARYKAQVASHLVGVCERQLTIGARHDEADAAAWARLLGADAATSPSSTRDLCAAIRSGALDDRFSETLETILERVVDDVRVVRPSHLDRAR